MSDCGEKLVGNDDGDVGRGMQGNDCEMQDDNNNR